MAFGSKIELSLQLDVFIYLHVQHCIHVEG